MKGNINLLLIIFCEFLPLADAWGSVRSVAGECNPYLQDENALTKGQHATITLMQDREQRTDNLTSDF